mgnify:CR=1 FL=1
MKTNEFIKSVEALGFQTHVREREIRVCDEMRGYGVDDPMFILTSDLPEVYIPNEFYISSLERRGALKLIIEYLDTPNSEREEDKLYDVIFPTIQRDGNFIYMAKDNSNGDPLGIDWSDSIYMKRNPTNFAFTEQEIKDIDERYLAFKVEVKDE